MTFTATVLAGTSPVTSGTVTFSQGGTALGAAVNLNSSGQAAFTTSSLAAGNDVITATYNPSTGFKGSTSPTLTQQVVASTASTTTGLTSSLNPSNQGQAVTLTASVLAGTSPVTTGSVTFSQGGTALGAAVNLNSRPGRVHHIEPCGGQ